MRVLAVPQWSFGRDRRLLARFREILTQSGCDVHDCTSNTDHNRTATAFSGEAGLVAQTILRLAEDAFDAIDLNRHTGVHPRIGALDVCPFVPLRQGSEIPDELAIRPYVLDVAESLAAHYELPVYLYEKSERDRAESELPDLRKGGFGGLFGRKLHPDFGPSEMHGRLGVAVVGVRDHLLSFGVLLNHDDGTQARRIARLARQMRSEGDPRFPGVRAMGFVRSTIEGSEVNVVSTLPDLAAPDPIVEFVLYEAALHAATLAGTELVGVIRPRDLPNSSRLQPRPAQVVQGLE